METPTFANQLGAKGVGESGTIGAIPAVYNAVVDALGAPRRPPLETPLTPERLWSRTQRVCTTPGAADATLGYARTQNDQGVIDMSTQSSTRPSKGASVSHLVLNVRDIEASHHFYTELLGFDQCAELTHTMTMRFYRGNESHHHDFALVQVADPDSAGPPGAVVDGAPASRREPHRDRLSRPRVVAERSSST